MNVTKKVLRADLKGNSIEKFSRIKEFLNVKSDAEVIRYLIGQEYRRIKNKLTLKTLHLKSDNLTEEQLIEAANDYAKAYGHLDPEGVTEFLKERYYWLSKTEIERGVNKICSMKIKN